MTNFDETTGIRYGVISPHSISSFALDDIYQKGTDPHYESSAQEIRTFVRNMAGQSPRPMSEDIIDQIETILIDDLNEGYENPDGQMDYSDPEYTLHVSGDNFGIFVMKSPYYTYCRDCSPCAPGAGDLDSPVQKEDYESFLIAGDPRCYVSGMTLCLGPEWFDKDNDQYSRKIPYRVFRVSDDSEVCAE